jgi:hypothetical protein
MKNSDEEILPAHPVLWNRMRRACYGDADWRVYLFILAERRRAEIAAAASGR